MRGFRACCSPLGKPVVVSLVPLSLFLSLTHTRSLSLSLFLSHSRILSPSPSLSMLTAAATLYAWLLSDRLLVFESGCRRLNASCNERFGKSLISLGFAPHRCINIIGFNAAEWFIANMGAIAAGGIAAGIYTSNLPEVTMFSKTKQGADRKNLPRSRTPESIRHMWTTT